MARSYRFAVVRFAPDDTRGESLNIGVVVFNGDHLDLRLTKRLDRVKSISSAVRTDTLLSLLKNIEALDSQAIRRGTTDVESRLKSLGRIGPLAILSSGQFFADTSTAYENRIAAVMEMLVEPEPAPKQRREKKSRLFSQVKKSFRAQNVLALRDEGLESHRIVATYELDDGLIADMVLRNGSYHVIETVDASGNEHAFRRTVSEIAVSALVLERARMRFGEEATKARLVYSASAALERIARPSLDAAEHQGAELINWESDEARNRFVRQLVSMSTPAERPKKVRLVAPESGSLFH
jgi:Protein of unknown function (DUF3037)